MNHDCPREILRDGQKTGLWRYTTANDRSPDRAYAIGHCAENCPGHDTPEGACEHQRQYLLDHMRVRERVQEWPKHRCQVEGCNQEATRLADIDAYTFFLVCADHANRESIDPLVKVGESWHS